MRRHHLKIKPTFKQFIKTYFEQSYIPYFFLRVFFNNFSN